MGLTNLIEALTIFRKYADPVYPTDCEHGEFCVLIDPALVSPEDLARLAELSFLPRTRDWCFYSSRYGSA